MGIIRTDKWLIEDGGDPLKVCQRINPYFKGVTSLEIFHHLSMSGMYRKPLDNEKAYINILQTNRIWTIVQQEYIKLKRWWNGPQIPIFILPSDSENRQLKRDYNQKSGLAFDDKLFLFISEHNTEKEIKALFTHEYHHVCRLHQNLKNEEDFKLLDTIILEGLAEHAVLERLGKSYVAKWSSYYTNKELEDMWKRLIQPAHQLPISHPKHKALLYGLGIYPKMAGYGVGFYLVQKFKENTHYDTKQLLNVSAETIALGNSK